MILSSGAPLRWMVPAGVVFVLLLLSHAGGAILAGILPTQADDVRWRFGAFGIAAGQLLTLLAALLLGMVLAGGQQWRRTLRALAVLALVGVLVLSAGAINFGLDALTLYGEVSLSARPGFILAVIRVATIALVAGALLLVLGVGGWRGTRRADRRRGGGAPVPVVQRSGETALGLRPATVVSDGEGGDKDARPGVTGESPPVVPLG